MNTKGETMPKRKSLSKKLRFEVFKRDKFACQYCGRKAPDVLLVIDHIHPVAKGGKNEILNLVTSCEECNAGKSDRTISDDSALSRQHSQLAQLQERREQLDLLFAWKNSLLDLEDHAATKLVEMFPRLVPGFMLNDGCKAFLKTLLKTYSADDIATAMQVSAAQKLVIVDGKVTAESAAEAWHYVPKVCRFRARNGGVDNEEIRQACYVRAIVRNRHGLSGYENHEALELIKTAQSFSVPFEELREMACEARSAWHWFKSMRAFCSECESDHSGQPAEARR